MNHLDDKLRKLYIQYLEDHVSPKRVHHSLGVAHSAAYLAQKYGADPVKAETAGLLHDCAKGLTDEQMIQAARGFGMTLDNYQLTSPHILHAHVGAFMAQRDLGIDDPEVLCAMRRHIFGAPDMTVLDAVVNLADYIEPTRNYPDVEEIRKMAEGSLFDTLCECLGRTMILTIHKGEFIVPDTLMTWNALKLRAAAKEGETT